MGLFRPSKNPMKEPISPKKRLKFTSLPISQNPRTASFGLENNADCRNEIMFVKKVHASYNLLFYSMLQIEFDYI